jgi:hypothetical protein
MHVAGQGISRVQSVSSGCHSSNRCRASSRVHLTSSVRMHSMHSALNKACLPRELPNPRAEPLRDADLGSQSCVKPCRIAVAQRDDWPSIKFKRAAPRLISGDSRSPAACEQDLKHERFRGRSRVSVVWNQHSNASSAFLAHLPSSAAHRTPSIIIRLCLCHCPSAGKVEATHARYLEIAEAV